MSFDKKTFSQEHFNKLVLTEETISERTFDECVFTDCAFLNCRFEKCRFRHCTFGKCDLSNLNPMNSEFFDVKFNGCKAIGIDWTRALIFKDNSLTDCLVNYSNFRFRKMQGFVLKKCEAKEVDFIETDLTGANFRHTDFENATFFKTNLTKADFTGAVNYGIDVTNNVLKEARFSLPEALSLLDGLEIVIE